MLDSSTCRHQTSMQAHRHHRQVIRSVLLPSIRVCNWRNSFALQARIKLNIVGNASRGKAGCLASFFIVSSLISIPTGKRKSIWWDCDGTWLELCQASGTMRWPNKIVWVQALNLERQQRELALLQSELSRVQNDLGRAEREIARQKSLRSGSIIYIAVVLFPLINSLNSLDIIIFGTNLYMFDTAALKRKGRFFLPIPRQREEQLVLKGRDILNITFWASWLYTSGFEKWHGRYLAFDRTAVLFLHQSVNAALCNVGRQSAQSLVKPKNGWNIAGLMTEKTLHEWKRVWRLRMQNITLKAGACLNTWRWQHGSLKSSLVLQHWTFLPIQTISTLACLCKWQANCMTKISWIWKGHLNLFKFSQSAMQHNW